ncbi:uncharacterized protein LOC107640847 [Arachis ipaensis]|uniref:uncharacterized protein LOC107640847 n=1 Tax=Arachis ipaensis TaxID=130454 RepID=UPI0007AFA761|nr:uncharacterized protein LOC107640847 [Arachis ipaensis]XP_025652779.1 uncharacterized protein LOC112748750 [Arachis hypogaea]
MDAILAHNKMITKQLADLTKQMERNQAAAIHTQPQAQEELTVEEENEREQANYIGNASRQAHDPYSKTYNPGWKNYPNFGWGNQQNDSQDQKPHNSNYFPTDTEKNPRGETKNVRWEECKAITLRDEEILEEEIRRHPKPNTEESRKNVGEAEHEINLVQMKEPILRPYVPKAPYPQRLRGGEKEKTYSTFLDTFKSLHINITSIETLQQMPSYIKCMKELLTKKNTVKGGQIVVMNKESSALIQKELPSKKKDPGSFHIPCAIGDTMIDRGFCDLGASINLIPLSLMKKLQINVLKSTDVIL